MKKSLFVIRKMMVGLMLASVLIATTASATTTKKAITPAINIQPTVEFIGGDDASTLLHVNFEAETAVKFELTVEDSNGEVVYAKDFESAKFSKYIKLVKEGEDMGLVVSIRTLPNGTKHNFSVTTAEKSITEISVSKM